MFLESPTDAPKYIYHLSNYVFSEKCGFEKFSYLSEAVRNEKVRRKVFWDFLELNLIYEQKFKIQPGPENIRIYFKKVYKLIFQDNKFINTLEKKSSSP
ncbi:hypothetical protein PGTUg99_030732 [Puccinia graminis f. sp. tritici]|uniref:Uncharacterized protein n=1 Tax=Puccinia graminis f. sp. tritici TaxID=56615 RepID=A0A5B0S496_PUCGR|nr:hypothetical protein PGTUg99_030732 [Puccinia graminis f. sp. tritici]